jgi:Cd2+/Zn2+-exporting ATPase
LTRIETLELAVKGEELIHCAGCENRIQGVISKLPGVLKVKADHTTQEIRITLDQDNASLKDVREKLDFMGYQTS